jgi:hypothetical protein
MGPARAEELGALDVVPLLLRESRPLSAKPGELGVIASRTTATTSPFTWESVGLEPGEHDTDRYVLDSPTRNCSSCATDAILDGELPRMPDAIDATRRKRGDTGVASPACSRLQAVVADTTEVVSRRRTLR